MPRASQLAIVVYLDVYLNILLSGVAYCTKGRPYGIRRYRTVRDGRCSWMCLGMRRRGGCGRATRNGSTFHISVDMRTSLPTYFKHASLFRRFNPAAGVSGLEMGWHARAYSGGYI